MVHFRITPPTAQLFPNALTMSRRRFHRNWCFYPATDHCPSLLEEAVRIKKKSHVY